MSSMHASPTEMETAALVVPVTALEFLQDSFLLTGEGPVLTAYSLKPRPKACAPLNVLQHYRIHGIRPRISSTVSRPSSATETHGKKKDGLSTSAEASFYDLAVFGGKAVRLVRLNVELHDGENWRERLENFGPLMELQDWALDVRWLSEDKRSLLGVAVAHNSALLLDVSTGTALAQCSCLEGCLLYSALLLVHTSWADTVLVGGTVFNQLVLWKPGGEGESNISDHKAPVERRLLGHSGVIFSISYLQEKGWLASASDDRSVRVWAVGAIGGPGGKCGDVNPVCLRVLFGHQARVFSVCLSPGKVFSAGEDGACLVWELAGGGTVVRTLKGHRAGGVRALAISEETVDEATRERWVATGGADGGVRLWRVEESEERKEKLDEAVTENLHDLKYSGQGNPKVVCIAGEEGESPSWSQSKFVVCTDRGAVYQYNDGQWQMLWQGASEFQSYCVMETSTISVKDSTAKVVLCAVGNLSGSIQVFQISNPQTGLLLTAGSGKIHSLVWQKGEKGMYLLASGAEGLVYRWCVEAKLNENCSSGLSVNSLPPFLLPTCAKRWLTAAVCLHSTSEGELWVCGDRRGSLLLFQGEENPDGEEETNEGLMTDRKYVLQPLSCLFGVHGKQGVTSVCEYQGLLYSTGRDGCVRVFRVHHTPPEKLEESEKDKVQLEVLRVQRACKGMEWLERVLILKPEIPQQVEEEVRNECESQDTQQYLKEKMEFAVEQQEGVKTMNKGGEARFVILGFHGVHFVVWDPVKLERLLVVPCGGGHRSWSLWPPHNGVWPGYGALIFIKQGVVLSSQPPGEATSWAGRAAGTGGWGLREGVHGRGIGCVCRLGRITGIKNEILPNTTADITGIMGHDRVKDEVRKVEEGQWEIVVTGGEDTSLTVLAIHPKSDSIKVLSVITDHISGVRTMAVVTHPEGESQKQPQHLSALLVSASGRAQIQCYRLLVGWDKQRLVPSCQVIQVACHRLDELWERRRNRHKMVKMDPETRYMSIAVVDEKTDRVLLALACSDGAVRFFSVSEVTRQIHLLWETFHHNRCVLSVATCSLEDEKGNRYNLLFSAATDGKIAVWDLTDTVSSLSASTPSLDPTPPIHCIDIPAHQSGINSLAVWAEKEGDQHGSCLINIASGGDDGQLTVSTIRVQYPEDPNIGGSRGFSQMSSQKQSQPQSQLHLHLHSQSHFPLAHASPLTALKLLSPGLIVTTSSDQRVCLWSFCSTGISHRGVLCSHVADAAGLAVWEGQVIREEDEKRKTMSEQEILFRGRRGDHTGLKTKDKTAEGKTGGRFSKERETTLEAEGGEPVEGVSKTDDPVCKIRDEKVEGTASNWRDQTGTDRHNKSEREVKEGRKRRENTGWVLVCGQGFQLLRIRNTGMDDKVWMDERREQGKGDFTRKVISAIKR